MQHRSVTSAHVRRLVMSRALMAGVAGAAIAAPYAHADDGAEAFSAIAMNSALTEASLDRLPAPDIPVVTSQSVAPSAIEISNSLPQAPGRAASEEDVRSRPE